MVKKHTLLPPCISIFFFYFCSSFFSRVPASAEVLFGVFFYFCLLTWSRLVPVALKDRELPFHSVKMSSVAGSLCCVASVKLLVLAVRWWVLESSDFRDSLFSVCFLWCGCNCTRPPIFSFCQFSTLHILSTRVAIKMTPIGMRSKNNRSWYISQFISVDSFVPLNIFTWLFSCPSTHSIMCVFVLCFLQWNDAWVWCSQGLRWWSWRRVLKVWFGSSTWMSTGHVSAGDHLARARKPRVSQTYSHIV